MLKRGIPKRAIGYQNQTLNEGDDAFTSTIREIEKSRGLGGSKGQFELAHLTTTKGGAASNSINRV